jgi:hypothetical protein
MPWKINFLQSNDVSVEFLRDTQDAAGLISPVPADGAMDIIGGHPQAHRSPVHTASNSRHHLLNVADTRRSAPDL